MNRKTLALSLLATAAMAFATATSAFACACCAEKGQRFERVIAFSETDAFALQAIRGVMPDGRATLYTDAADWDEVIRGLNNPDQSTDYDVAFSRNADTWVVTLEDAKGNAGSLRIALPRAFELFAADTRPGDTESGNRVQLYKELRVTGVMTGSGMFEVSEKGTRQATLVFHGHGNGCTFAEDFHHWTLTASGPGARYSFFGKLRKAQ